MINYVAIGGLEAVFIFSKKLLLYTRPDLDSDRVPPSQRKITNIADPWKRAARASKESESRLSKIKKMDKISRNCKTAWPVRPVGSWAEPTASVIQPPTNPTAPGRIIFHLLTCSEVTNPKHSSSESPETEIINGCSRSESWYNI